jgi:hypothetical protein
MLSDDATSASDSAELKALIEQFFAAVSFDEGAQPAYGTLHDLFTSGGKLINTASQPPEIAGVDDFIQSRQRLVDAGELTSFEEAEVAGRSDAFGNVAHRLSDYEKSGTRNAVEFAARGVISTQFVKTPSGWRISSMAWDDEPGAS